MLRLPTMSQAPDVQQIARDRGTITLADAQRYSSQNVGPTNPSGCYIVRCTACGNLPFGATYVMHCCRGASTGGCLYTPLCCSIDLCVSALCVGSCMSLGTRKDDGGWFMADAQGNECYAYTVDVEERTLAYYISCGPTDPSADNSLYCTKV